MRIVINSLSVNEFGSREKVPILFVHGFPYDYTMWVNQIKTLQNDYYCVAYDVRGLGESYVGDGQYTMEAYVHDLYSVMDGMKLDRPILCGLSMGGYISLRAVEKERSRFRGLILVDTKADPDDNSGKLKRAAAIDQINVKGLSSFVDDFVPLCFAPETPHEKSNMYNNVLSKSKKHDPIGVKGAIFAMLSRTSTFEKLNEIDIPTLLLVGEYDTLTPPSVMKKMSGEINKSKIFTVPKAGHMTPLENPEFVNNKIKEFLKDFLVEGD